MMEDHLTVTSCKWTLKAHNRPLHNKYMIGDFANLNIYIKNKDSAVGMNFKIKSSSSTFRQYLRGNCSPPLHYAKKWQCCNRLCTPWELNLLCYKITNKFIELYSVFHYIWVIRLYLRSEKKKCKYLTFPLRPLRTRSLVGFDPRSFSLLSFFAFLLYCSLCT